MNRILIVDDDPISSLSLIRQLEELGHIVTSVDDTQKAIDIARALPPTTVLINIYLQGIDSYSFAEELRSLPRCDKVNIVALTHASDAESSINAMRAGCDDFLKIPVDLNLLKNKVNDTADAA
ncbi:response regulator [Aliikangiella marina]|uniref:response regulator n=1 Tax=Aliikangiella marina TaxID=1712262 RepID=UPI00163D5A61|nr:response regulator [Aliikangiella marina]